MKNKNTILIVMGLICALLVGAVAFTVLHKNEEKGSASKETESTESQSTYITYEGKKYKENPDISAMLFMGIDKSAIADLHNNPGENGQSDSLNLLIMNKKTNEAQILQISRDSMVDIDIYDINGEKFLTEQGQIALQYAYGDGEKKSCRLTVEKVSGLLFDVPVESYLSLTLEGMIEATDAIGGITLTIPEDYTEIDPAFVQGETITMNGELAEKYVRRRDIEVLDSNNQRMERQSQFMNALIQKLQEIKGNTQYALLYQQMEPYMVTNMTADELKSVAEYDISGDILKAPGEVIEKDGHAQYLVDDTVLKEMIIDLFYEET